MSRAVKAHSSILVRHRTQGHHRVNLSDSFEHTFTTVRLAEAQSENEWVVVTDVYGRKQAWRKGEIIGIEESTT